VPLDQIKPSCCASVDFEGEFVNKKRDGTPVLVTSRWTLQREQAGAAGSDPGNQQRPLPSANVRAGAAREEERWRRLFETSAAGMALEGLDGVFTAANRGCSE